MENKKHNKRPYDRNRKKKKEKKMKANSKRCPYCGKEMRCRGSLGCAGATSWKCKNKRCGRTMYEKKRAMPPEQLIIQSHVNKLM